MKTKPIKTPKNVRKLTKKETIIFSSFLIITILSIFIVGFLMAIALGFVLLIVFGFISNKEKAKEERLGEQQKEFHNDNQEISDLSTKISQIGTQTTLTTPVNEFKYPHLKKLELAIQEASREKKSANFSDIIQDYTKEEWEYLKAKYPKLQIPVTKPFHQFHDRYKNQYLALKPKIEANKRICLDEYDEKHIREFCKEDNLILTNVVRPLSIESHLAGVQYYDYSKKIVKEILDFSPNQVLSFELEPTNLYDSNAVKIYMKEYLLGYIPRDHSKIVFEAISNNEDVSVTLYKYEKSKRIDSRITVIIDILFNSN